MASWTAYDLQVLENAIKTGAKKVKYSNDKEVEYRDLSDMLKIRDIIKKDIEGSSAPNDRVSYTEYSR